MAKQGKNWGNINVCTPEQELIDAAGSEFLAKILVSRGINSVEKIDKFLNPEKIIPVSPYAFRDMEKTVNRIKKAIEQNEHILIYGDFDADGVTSTAVLAKTFSELGANFSHYIPDRQTESHGLNKNVLLTKISKEKVKLVITVDCGISNNAEISLIQALGVDTIITDHHEAKDEIPQAYSVIDAKAEGVLADNLSFDEILSLTQLAGVGVAFKLACALLDEYKKIQFTENLLPLVALGTVADIVPLLNDNRLFVYLGMKLMQDGKNLGITSLLSSAGIVQGAELTSDKVAFALAPRINAAGRLDNAEEAFKLLTSENKSEVEIYTQSLNNLNKLRQQLCDDTYLEALEYIEKNDLSNDSAIFAYNKNWHIGIIGIVASKLTEKFNKPVFMFTDSPDEETYRCSIRSVPGVNIFNVLEMSEQFLDSYGGHSMAAGLAISKQGNKFNEFKNAVNQILTEQQSEDTDSEVLIETFPVVLSDLSLEMIENIKKLEPFGEGNPTPIFSADKLKLISERQLGEAKRHLKFCVQDSSLNTVDCVFWNHSTLNIPLGSELEIAFSPQINEFNGVKSLQLDIKDYFSAFVNENSCEKNIKILDHRKKENILPQVADYIATSQSSFKIFAERKEILEKLSSNEILSDCVATRKNINKTEQLMFFDYPANQKLLKKLVEKSGATTLHFMNYNISEYDIDTLISKISGMLKYAYSKYSGIACVEDIAVANSITNELTMLILKLLNRTGVVNISDYKNDCIKFEFSSAIPMSLIKEHELYEQCRIELFKSKNFKEELLSAKDISKYIV